MTEKETLKIMAMLGAFYGHSKIDPKEQAGAWHMILRKYDFKTAEQAVMSFAEHDVRDYATYPSVGKIVQAIREEEYRIEKPIKDIIHAIAYGQDYLTLSDTAKQLISGNKYEEWLNIDAEEFQINADKYAASLRKYRDSDIKKLQGEIDG